MSLKINYLKLYCNDGREIDISSITKVVEINESMSDKFIKGKIIFNDSNDSIEAWNIRGGESILFSYSTSESGTDPVNIYLIVYGFLCPNVKIDNLYGSNKEVGMLVCSVAYFNLLTDKICKKFSGMPDDILVELLKYTDPTASVKNKTYASEKQKLSIEFVAHNWKIDKIIDYMCQNSTSTNGYVTYRFFETLDGYEFKTIDFMQSSSAYELIDVNLIRGYWVDGIFNYESIASNVVTDQFVYNIKTDEYKEVPITISSMNSNGVNLEKYSLFNSVICNNKKIGQSVFEFESDEGHYFSELKSMNYKESYSLSIAINPVRSRKPGNLIKIIIPKENEFGVGIVWSGKYLIYGIKHVFSFSSSGDSNGDYFQMLYLLKDGFIYDRVNPENIGKVNNS